MHVIISKLVYYPLYKENMYNSFHYKKKNVSLYVNRIWTIKIIWNDELLLIFSFKLSLSDQKNFISKSKERW